MNIYTSIPAHFNVDTWSCAYVMYIVVLIALLWVNTCNRLGICHNLLLCYIFYCQYTAVIQLQRNQVTLGNCFGQLNAYDDYYLLYFCHSIKSLTIQHGSNLTVKNPWHLCRYNIILSLLLNAIRNNILSIAF